MSVKLSKHWWWEAGLIVAVSLGIMFLSVWRQLDSQVEQSLVGSALNDEVMDSASLAAQIRGEPIKERGPLPQLKYLPHHPLYFLWVMEERIKLWLAQSELEKVELMLTYADERMGLSNQLLRAGKGREAIEAGIKGYMYALEAADVLRNSRDPAALFWWHSLAQSLALYEQTMIELRLAVNDNFKAKVDLIISGIERLRLEATDKNTLKSQSND